jgi:hypothetical protein
VDQGAQARGYWPPYASNDSNTCISLSCQCPSRSARRKKAKRHWLKEQLKAEKKAVRWCFLSFQPGYSKFIHVLAVLLLRTVFGAGFRLSAHTHTHARTHTHTWVLLTGKLVLCYTALLYVEFYSKIRGSCF